VGPLASLGTWGDFALRARVSAHAGSRRGRFGLDFAHLEARLRRLPIFIAQGIAHNSKCFWIPEL
jgi:hypothetical protein